MSYLLLSETVARKWGGQVEQVLAGTPHRILTLPPQGRPPLDAATLQRVALGYFSRDLLGETGGTGKSTPDTKAFFKAVEEAPNLRWLQVFSAGLDRPVYTTLRQRGVALTTSAGANAPTVALTAVTAILMLSRRLPLLMAAQRAHEWKPLRGGLAPQNLAKQTVTVVGLGPIGQEIARLLQAVGTRVIGVRYGRGDVPGCDRVITYVELGDVLPATDWLVIACPLTDLTRGLIDRAALARLPAGANLINVGRGSVVVEADLIEALRAGTLAGAYLDVFAREPLDADSPLWDMENVVVSPHTAAAAVDYEDLVAEVFLDNLARWIDGTPMRGLAPSLA